MVSADWFCFDNFRLFRIPGMPSGIRNIPKHAEGGVALYDLAGRKISSGNQVPSSGIYVMNGRKIAIR